MQGMKLYKIYETVVPSMQNTPCKLAVFTDDAGGFKVFQKMLWKSGRIGKWERNFFFKSVKEVEECVNANNKKASEPMQERAITNATWERYQKRIDKAILRNMGY